jgi:tRNA nucleotidyltransferase (CCA-adding enzyme)
LKKPNITFFLPNKVKPWSLENIKNIIQKQNCKYIGLKFEKPDIIVENLYPQVRKAVRSIWESCERNDFTIFDMKFHIDNKEDSIYIILKTKDELLPDTQIHTGPPVKMKKNAEDFQKKWAENPRVIKKPYEKNDRLFVELRRDYTDIKDFLRINTKKLSLGKHIDKIVKKKYELLNFEDLLTNNLKEFWTEYLDGKMSWER